MWMHYVVRILLLGGAVVACLYLWNIQKGKEAASEADIELAEKIATRWDPASAESEVFKLLVHYYLTKTENPDEERDIWVRLSDGFASSEDPKLKSGRNFLTAAMKLNYANAEEFGAFDTDRNISLMQAGQAPIIQKGPYFNPDREIYLSVNPIISPIFAPESAGSLVNLLVVPETVANLRVEEVDGFVIKTAKQLRAMAAINQESFDLLTTLERKQREDN